MHIFISYAKVDTHDLAVRLRDELRQLDGVTVWMDETLEPGESWAIQIQDEIDLADYVIALLSPDVNRPIQGKQHRSFVLNEIDYAQQAGKPIIPIMVEHTRVPVQIAGIEYLDFTTDQSRAMARLIHKLSVHKADPITAAPPAVMSSPLPAASHPAESISSVSPKTATAPRFARRSSVIVGILGVLVLLVAAALLPSFVPRNAPASPTGTQGASVGAAVTEDSTLSVDAAGTQAAQGEENTRQAALAATGKVETQVANQQLATQQVNIAATNVVATQIKLSQLATQQVEADATNAVATRINLSLMGVKSNTDWKPVYQSFNGIEMALVPVGCFMMGSAVDDDNEKPVTKQCFDKPFWIDRYEVTNRQFGSSGEFHGNLNPRDSTSWYDAYQFCAKEGGYVPTEREWEYAAPMI